MTIEEKIENALLDLEGLILEGTPVEDAVNLAAEPYGLRPDVLHVRAAAPSGEIAAFVERVKADAESIRVKSVIEKTAQQFVEVGHAWHLRDNEIQHRLGAAVEKALGRPPTVYEMTLAKENRIAAVQRRQQENHRVIIKAIEAWTGDEEDQNAPNQ